MLYRWMKIKVLLIALLLVAIPWLLIACQSPNSSSQIVTVDRAVSGNTIELNLAGQVQRVRLIGVNAPNLGQKPWGTAAKDRLNAMIQAANQKFSLELEPVEAKAVEGYRYGYLWQDQTLVNEQLVKEGQGLAATRYLQPKYERRFVRAQAYARLMAVGIWSHDAPLRSNPGGK
jgi:micrococcal nuclease